MCPIISKITKGLKSLYNNLHYLRSITLYLNLFICTFILQNTLTNINFSTYIYVCSLFNYVYSKYVFYKYKYKPVLYDIQIVNKAQTCAKYLI